MPTPNAHNRAIADHRKRWGEPELIARAPGRVNLIGEHTDYNEGFTMPMALPFDTVFAISRDGDPDVGAITVVSEGFGEVRFVATDDPSTIAPWARFIVGVVVLLRAAGVPSGGWRGSVASDIPTGASLSSSASVEIACALGVLALNQRAWPPVELAKFGQRVENEVIGLPSGIMDQLISAGAVAGHASLMDCRDLTLTPKRFPPDVVIAVMDTGTRRILAEGAYGDRQAECVRASVAIGVRSLRDATLDQVATIEDHLVRRRARHVVTENDRTLAAADAMDRGDERELGRLMSESHVSLRDDFEVSAPALDHIVEVALSSPGCLGARMTGGGFAGCAVALVRIDEAESFSRSVIERCRFDDHKAQVWICAPSAGASVTTRVTPGVTPGVTQGV